MSGQIVRVAPEGLQVPRADRKTIDDAFRGFLGGLNGAEKGKRQRHKARIEGMYHEWASILQNVTRQFRTAAGVFLEIEGATDQWVLGPRRIKRAVELPREPGGNGYAFDISINYLGPVSRAERDRYSIVSSTLTHCKKQIMLLYANGSFSPYLHKSVIWGMGGEEDFGLPIGYALKHDTIKPKELRKAAVKRKKYYRAMFKAHEGDRWRYEHYHYPAGALERRLTRRDYDLTDFYNSSRELRRCLERAQNQMVVVGVKTPEGKECRNVEVGRFCEHDIELALKAAFVHLNRDEFRGIRAYLPG